MPIPLQNLDIREGRETLGHMSECSTSRDWLNRRITEVTQEYHQLIQREQATNVRDITFISQTPGRRPTADLRSLGELADKIYKSRRKRSEIMPGDIFGEPAWDILLDLFGSECRGRQISVTSACIASAVPATTALRWIAVLMDAGLVARREDPADRRRAYVELTPKGRSAMAQHLAEHLDT